MDAAEFLYKINAKLSGVAQSNTELAKLEEQIRKGKSSLAGLEAQLAKSSGSSAIRLKERIASQKDALKLLEGGRGVASQADAMKASAKAAKESEDAFRRTAGPIGGLIEKTQKFTKALGTAGGLAGAAIAAATAVFTLIAAVTTFAIYAADAARSTRLLNEAAARGVAAGAELTAVIGDLANRVPLAKDKIGEMARALEYAKFQGRQMQVVLQAMATVAAVAGDSAAEKIKAIAESSRAARVFLLGARDIYGEFAGLAGTGLKSADIYGALADRMGISIARAKSLLLAGKVSVKQGLEALNLAVQGRFGATVEAQMLSMGTQLTKLKENFMGLFSGLNLEPLLKGFKMLVELFAQNTAAGRRVKLLTETLLQPLINGLGVAMTLLRSFFLGMGIGALLVVIPILKLRKAILSTFGDGIKSSIDWVTVLQYVGRAVAGAVTMIAAVVFGLVFLMVKTVQGIVGAASLIVDFFGSISLGEYARNWVNSFIENLSIDRIVAAMTKLGTEAKNAMKRALGIASPSRPAMEFAQNVVSTFSGTVEEGTGETRAAFSRMIDVRPSVPRGGGAGASSGHTVNFNGPVYLGGGLTKESLRAWLLEILSEEAASGPDPEPA